MSTWIHDHPWMTFFLIGGAVSTIGAIFEVHDLAKVAAATPTPTPAAGTGALRRPAQVYSVLPTQRRACPPGTVKNAQGGCDPGGPADGRASSRA